MSKIDLVLFLGDSNVGKTAVIKRIIDDEFEVEPCNTIGLEMNNIEFTDYSNNK